MNLYIGEILSYVIVSIIIVVIFKLKGIQKLKIVIPIITLVFAIALGLTFYLEKPAIEYIEKELSIEVKEYESIPTPHATYHFKDVSDTVKINGEVDYNTVGKYEIEYEIPTLGSNYKVKQIVNVVDTVAPKIILNGDKEYNQSYVADYYESGYTVEDNYDVELNDKVEVTKEEISDIEYNLIYTVSDNAGNIGTETRKVRIVDDVAPEIKLNGNSTVNVLVGTNYEEKGATAIDEKDGDLTEKIAKIGEVDVSQVGTYTITYTVEDNSGNKATKTRKVNVYNQVAPATSEKIEAQNGSNGPKGVIYLTFDDGPSESITPKILDILQQKNVKATFFIINYNESGERLVKREYNEGHTVAIHGYSHEYSKIYQSVDTYMNNLDRLQEKIKQTTGYTATVTRFPGGSSNTISRRYCVGIMTALSQEVQNRGYRYFDWNVDSNDAGNARTSQDVYRNVTKGLSKERSNVVLMHDFSGNTKTLNALADIIDYGLNNGYTFRAITESTPMVTHSVNN